LTARHDPATLTREDRETLRLIQLSRRQQAADAALRQALTRLLLDLGSRLNAAAKPNGEQ